MAKFVQDPIVTVRLAGRFDEALVTRHVMLSDGKFVKRVGSKLVEADAGAASKVQLGAVFDGGNSAIKVGVQVDIRSEEGFTIDDWYLLANQIGSIQIDVWRDSYVNYPPTDADSMPGAGNEPAIVTANKATGTASGWTLGTVTAGDVIRFNVDSVSSIKRVTLLLIGTKT